MSILAEKLAITQTSSSSSETTTTFNSDHSLGKPSPDSRGVFGGYLIGQSVYAAYETVPPNFKPHSIHCYFIFPGNDALTNTINVEKVSTSRNYAKRFVQLYQGDQLCVQLMVSFTQKNSSSSSSTQVNDFQSDLPLNFKSNMGSIKEIDLFDKMLTYKFSPQYLNYRNVEESSNPANRQLYYHVKTNDKIKDPKFQYVYLSGISDSFFLASLPRILHKSNKRFWHVSLDHSLYFHDDDFDCNEWLLFVIQGKVLTNDRVLLEGKFYNGKGKLIASVFQEGLVYFKDSKL